MHRFVFAVVFLATYGYAYQFKMEGAQRRCFAEDIPISTRVVVTYTVLQGSGGEAPMSLKAFAHDGTSVYDQEHITSSKFGFKSADTMPGISREEYEKHEDEAKTDEKVISNNSEGGNGNTLRYTFCFEQKPTGHHMPSLHAPKVPSRRVIFSVKFGTDAKTLESYRELAKEKHLSTTEQLFKAVEDQVSDVIKDIDDMRTRERRMDLLNKKTSALVLWYSLSACLFVVGGAVLSSFATQSFLMKRNIL